MGADFILPCLIAVGEIIWTAETQLVQSFQQSFLLLNHLII